MRASIRRRFRIDHDGCACHRSPPVTVNTVLLRLDAPWTYPSPEADRRVRTAPATIATFRAGGEFVELHCWLIEQPDETLYIASRNSRVVS